ncbi:telomerase protein component 1-like [Acanthaster planci]|uniref:Telomerase protein component 1-like n=1 Tax=Acanthaster planci TaxID=133434 RepID=A0A8B7Z4H4_ACAPL|nr:telomerase protein component 1-like [Acanthaster planci]
MKTELRQHLDNPLLTSSLARTGTGGPTRSVGTTPSPQLSNPRLQSSSKSSGALLTTSGDKNALASHAAAKPLSIHMKQESLSLQHSRLRLGSKLTPLSASSSLLSSTSLKTGGLLSKPPTSAVSSKSALLPKSPHVSTTSTLISGTPTKAKAKPATHRRVQLESSHLGYGPSSHPRAAQSKETAENTAQIHVAELATDFEIPNYNFHGNFTDAEDQFWDLDDETCFEAVDPEMLSLMISSEDAKSKKTSLINLVSASLVNSPSFKLPKDETRLALTKNADTVIQIDPEFVLKVALYTRQDLNIRATANFLLALAANRRECRPYLKKYYKRSVGLPSDWAQIADLYLSFQDKELSYRSLPSALRKVMVAKFPDFDEYQLGKYNKTKKNPKKRKFDRKKKMEDSKTKEVDDSGESEDDEDHHDEEGLSSALPFVNEGQDAMEPLVEGDDNYQDEYGRCDFYTLKQLIRKLHITEPVESVMCLVGKKYPESLEAFYKTRLPGTWDPDRAGKRMKLPTPETWETQVSLKGNKASIWEQLIDHKKLPFMAMLRNLRNMIQAGVGPKYHAWIIRKLTDEKSVINSRQFPVRFFSAYDVLDSMETALENKDKESSNESESFRGRGRGRGRGRRGRGGGPKGGRWKKKPMDIKYNKELLVRYRKALDTAVKIATRHNIKPIYGKTYLFCDIGTQMDSYAYGSHGLRKVRECAILLGLMCKHSCEECMLVGYMIDEQKVIELEKGTLLDNIKSIVEYAQANDVGTSFWSAPPSKLNMAMLNDALRDRIHIDNLIVIGKDFGEEGSGGDELMEFVAKYRQVVNPNLLFVQIDLDFSYRADDQDKKPSHPNDIRVTGYSDNILRFIAERGDSGQLNHVENIDKAYGLRELQVAAIGRADPNQTSTATSPETPLPIAAPVHRWRTARVFISSTFRDMHGERDLLTRFVFPELRARAKKRFLNVFEVDLRWGVTEEETRQNRSVEICLTEVSRCDYFVGILGQRYGFCPDTYATPATPEFDWLQDYPAGRSITELEMQHAALCDPQEAVGRAFFYFRNSDFMAEVPPSCQSAFQAETGAAAEKIENLKQRIRHSGLEVFDGYPCRFGGIVDYKPVTTNLEELGMRVVNNLWNSFLQHYPEEEAFLDELSHEGALHQAFLEAHVAGFSGRKVQLRQGLDLMDACHKGLMVIAGKSGCGKTALMSCLAQRYRNKIPESDSHHVLVHFVGAAVGSSNGLAMLRRLCLELKKRFALVLTIPEDYNKLMMKFPEFLKGAAVHCGSSPLVIFLDGLDQMEEAYQAKNMEWLPKEIPKDVMFVVSTVVDSQSHKALLRRNASTLTLGPLDLLDKATVVRRMLAVHRKTLDESPFNNQMKLLVAKREANSPLFLSLACEELRIFGVFEQVSERLKRMSHTISALLQEVMQRLEGDHGKDLLSTALALLVCARDGLLEDELHSLLSLHTILGGSKYRLEDIKNVSLTAEHMLPQAVFAKLLRSLQGFLRPLGEQSVNHLSLAHDEINKAVRQRYLKGSGTEAEARLHALLAGYFLQEADPLRDGSWAGRKPRAFSEVSHHLSRTSAYAELQGTLCSLPFIYAKCRMGLASQLLDDFVGDAASSGAAGASRAALRDREKFLAKQQVQEFRSFVSRNLHVISNLPALTWQQAANEPSESAVCQSMKSALDSGGAASRQSLLVWKNKREDQEDCAMTIAGFPQAVTCLAISADGMYVACGNEDCTVKLFERETAKTASVDQTLSLWDANQGHRIAVLKGHRRRVSSCCHSGRCSMIVSASWDCSLRLWDDSDGRLLDTLSDNTPINCVAFHPEGRMVVTGGWDAAMKIWHVEEKKRLGILRGHKASVRAVAYSPSGAHIASASLDGTVKIWSSKTGTQVGGLDGHVMPINRLAFSPNGRQLVTVSDDQRVKVWSGNLGRKTATFGLDRYGHVTAAVIGLDGMQVAVGYHGGSVRLYETNSGAVIWEVQHHQARVMGLRWVMTPGGQRELLAGWDSGDVALLSGTKGSVNTVLASHLKPVTSLAYSMPNRLAAATYEDNTIHIWRLPYDRKPNQKTLDCLAVIHATCNGTVTCCGFSVDGTRLATGSKDASLQVWSMESDYISGKRGKALRPLAEIHACHKDWVTALCWSDSNDFLVTASNDFTLKLWDMKAMNEKCQFIGHTSAINAVAYSQGCVVSACFDGTIRVWSHKGIEITTLYGHNSRVNCCDIFVSAKQLEDLFEDLGTKESGAPSQPWSSMVAKEEWKDKHEKRKLDKVEMVRLENVVVATGGDDAMTHLWKPLQGNEMASLSGHSDSVVAVAVSGKGDIITGSLDKTVKIWTPKLEAQILSVSHNGEVTSTAYSTKGTFAVSTSRSGEVMVWEMPDKNSSADALPKMVFSSKLAEKAINSVTFLGNTRFALGSDEGVVTVWEIEAPTPPNTAYRVPYRKTMFAADQDKSPVTCMTYDPLRDSLYTGHWSGMICMFRCDSGKTRRVHQRGSEEPSDWVLDLKILKDNTLVASFANGELQHFKNLELERSSKLSIVDPSTKEQSVGYQEPCWVHACTGLQLRSGKTLGLGEKVSGKNRAVLTGDSKGYLTVCDVMTDEVIARKKVHTSAVHDIAVCDDVICTASEDSALKLWSRKNLKQVGQFYCQAPVTTVTASPVSDSTEMICGDKLGNVYFLDWRSRSAEKI